MSENTERDPRMYAIPDTHGHAKGEHKAFADERPLPLTARMLFLWFYHACRRGYPRFLMVADHMNYLTFEDPAAVNLVRRALKLAQAGDLHGAAETASVEVPHAAVVSEGLRRGMHFSIGAEVDNDPRSRPDAQNIVDAMRPDGIIRSVHFLTITHPTFGENWHWPFDNPEFKDVFEIVGTEQTWELYVAALVDAIERLPGHIVGHFFVPAAFGHWPDDAKLNAYEDRVLDAAAARSMAIEFNTRYLYRDHSDEEKARYLEANKRLLRKAKDRGVAIAVGSDAHSPKDQGGAFDVVLAVLDELEINEIVFPLGGSLRRVALRVVREPEPEPAPPAPEPPRSAEGAPDDADAVKPVRKARPRPKATRPAETSPERPAERPETAPAAETPPEAHAAHPPEAAAQTPAAVPPAEPSGEERAAQTPASAAPPNQHDDAVGTMHGESAPAPRQEAVRAKPRRAPKAPSGDPAAATAAPESTQHPEPARNGEQSPERTPVAKAVAALAGAAKAVAEVAKAAVVPEKAPASKAPSAAKASSVAKAAPVPQKAASAPAKTVPASTKPAPAPAKTALAKPQPSAKTPAAAKAHAPAKNAAHGKAAPAKNAASAKNAPAKSTPAKSAKKPAAAKTAAKKPAPAKAASARKPAPKKAAPAKKSTSKAAAAKKAAPAKKAVARKATAAKKAAPARSASARKASAAKKTTKKTATKRR